MAFPSSIYAPPSVYTRTNFESPIQGGITGLKIPFLIGTGSEILSQGNLEVIRGSSAIVDQQIVQEDMAGRVVVSELASGEVVLGDFDGALAQVQVRNYPIVTGNGTGTTSTRPSDVTVVLNGSPVVVLAIDGAKGILTLSEIPKPNDDLKVTYFFNRTDTLITDDVSSQVSDEGVSMFSQQSENYTFEEATNVLKLTVDGSALAITLSGEGVSASQVVAQIKSGAGSTSLSAEVFTNNEGDVGVKLTADSEIIIGDGGANVVLGLAQGESSGRTKTFYVFNGPIVDGTNGGVSTTDTSDVVVKIDNVQVIPVSVDGVSRAVTLAVPPKAGSTITIQYYFNTWQDTFDYLAHTGITEIKAVGETPDKATYIQGVDYVLKDDKILWGTATLVEAGDHTQGGAIFGENQVSSSLVDSKAYLEPCTAVVDTSVSPALASKTKFVLPFVPTTGNGRNTPIGQSLFQTVSNGRIDLPTNRPDLVKAYWGYSAQDAMDRGEVAVLSVDHETATITLKESVPVGASVWATLYYNVIQDAEHKIVCSSAGISGIGEYEVQTESGASVLVPQYAGKAASLATVSINFPSGSELLSDVRFESPRSVANFKGQVEEIVTVTFTSTQATPAKYSLKSVSPFAFIDSQSDELKLVVDGATQTIALATSFEAHLLGDEAVYTDAGYTKAEIVAGVNDNLVLTIDGQQVDVTLTPSALATADKDVSDFVGDINTAVDAVNPTFTGLTKFLVGFDIVGGQNDALTFKLSSGDITITLTAANYPTASDLVDEINARIVDEATGAIAKLTGNNTSSSTDPTAARIEASVNTLGQIVFTFAESDVPSATNCSFDASEKLAQQIGLDASVITFDSDYVASSFASISGTGGEKLHDRLILKNRIEPKGYVGLAQSGLSVDVCTASSELGLERGDYASAGVSAVVKAATVIGEVGLSGSQDGADSDVLVTLYQSGGTTPQNNIFKANIDGVPFTVELKDNALTAIASGASADVKFENIVSQLNTALTNATVTREGFSIRITSNTTGISSSVIVGDGNANDVLGLSRNQSGSRTLTTIPELVSCIEGTSAYTGLVGVISDQAGAEYAYIQSTTTGTGSNVSVASSTALLQGTNFVDESGDGAVGESGVSGFVVSSSDSVDGSGTINNSILSGTGEGQDGLVGQTYRDLVTGLTFTILPRDTGAAYPASSTISFNVSKKVVSDANLPVNAIAGVSLVVSNTSGVIAGDSAVVSTYKRTGAQPEISDNYFVSYDYAKQDFQPRLFSKLSTVESLFGSLDPSNPITLACYLMMTNGATAVGIQQVQKDEVPVAGKFTQASVIKYRDAVDALSGELQGGISADILVPLRSDSLELYRYMARHANLQSSIRYRAERTVIAGVGAGTQRETARQWAKAIQETRFRLVYPDIVYLTTTDSLGVDTQHLVGGEYVAAALTGLVVSPNRDVATPWTNSRLFGFDNLARVSDAVQKNQLASAGITVIEDANPALKVRHGLTTDMTNVLTKTPTVIQIADEVQQTTRLALDKFVGIKFLPSILSQVEGTLSMTMKEFVRKEIISAYTGIKANVSPDDPTVAEVEAYYQPVFPLLYLVVTFNMRASL